MLKSESLIQLVNNLTKQEKKEFSLYITNKSEKDYIFLFRLIDDKKISDPEELKKSFLTVKLHIPVDTRSAFPVISVQSPVSIQYRWQS